ncbi:hypothetical protein [Nonomuraea sp. NEAU-A123]|nr:hypothetical protein [Nonomuraea sp. NEAU-A123]MBT2224531.1 hypothetical protein [Nonomuraea sp. NEAU-A123]
MAAQKVALMTVRAPPEARGGLDAQEVAVAADGANPRRAHHGQVVARCS